MWRCHCGETNPNSQDRCPACRAARLTHESEPSSRGRLARPKNVQFSFFGMSGDVAPGEGGGGMEKTPRSLTERELDQHYAREKRRDILIWITAGLGVVALLGLLAWQVLRSGR